ncbi:MAG: hypothetical protein FWB76_05585 [Oscillospiraceae bacterium]|nr:hypothetical protein [Oscillospiraceae bacterium]
MRKIFTLALALLMAAGMLLAFTGCGSPLSNHELVGTWIWDADTNVHYVFNGDGTGNRGGNSPYVTPSWIQAFDWSVNESEVVLHFPNIEPGYVNRETHIFTITGNILNLVRRDNPAENFNYIRLGD